MLTSVPPHFCHLAFGLVGGVCTARETFSISDLKMLSHSKKNLHNNKATLNCFIAAIEIPLIHFSDGYLTLDFSIGIPNYQ